MVVKRAEGSSSPYLGRAENLVTSMGLAAAALLVCVMAASGLWVMRMEGRSAARARTRQIEAVGNILAQSGKVMLAADDLSALRRLVSQAGRDYGLTRCRVVIPGNLTVADAHLPDINAIQLPAAWGSELSLPGQAEPGDLLRQYILQVPGRGPARLELAAPVSRVSDTLWEAEAGLGSICILALLLLVALGRRMRQRFRLSMALCECLLAVREGERSRSVLTIQEDMGPEAAAWNTLLDELEQTQQKRLFRRLAPPAAAPSIGPHPEPAAAGGGGVTLQ